ncbi:MAG: hypothetical protein ACAH59_01765 [Pseudobdellovibrionaceae bacterium]
MDYEDQYEQELIHRRTPGFFLGCAYGLIAGSVLTFLMDPVRGRRRRALLRDQAIHLQKISQRYWHQKAIHFRNLQKGWEARSTKSQSPSSSDSYINPNDF